MTGFGNTGNLPLAIVSSFCHGKDNLFGENCHSNGLAYVSFAQWLAVILVYTLVYHMEPPKGYAQFVEEADESEEMEEMDEDGDLSRPLLQEVESPGMEDQDTEHSGTPFLANMFNSASNVSENRVTDAEAVREDKGKSPRPVRCLEEPRMVRKIRSVTEKTPIKNLLQPPTVASLLATSIIGVVPQLKAFVFGDDAPLSFIADSLEILAGAVVPLAMLILGGMLAEGPSKSKLGLRTTIGIIAARLLVLPLSGIGVVLLADKLNLLVEGDDMYRFVLLLQYTTPSAILLGAIASLRGYAVREASALVFWQHIFAVISISVYIVIYFRFLPTYS